MIETGRAIAVEPVVLGSELTADLELGATEVEVADLTDFSEDGGEFQESESGPPVTYTGIDEASSTLILESAFAGEPAPAEAIISVYPPAEIVYCHVQVDHVEGDTIHAVVDQAQRLLIEEGLKDDDAVITVVIEERMEGWVVVNVLAKPPVLTGGSLAVPDVNIAGFHVDESGNMAVGGTDSSEGNFTATADGEVTAKSLLVTQKDVDTYGIRVESAGAAYTANLIQAVDSLGLQVFAVTNTGNTRVEQALRVAEGITMPVLAADPATPSTGELTLYAKEDTGVARLFYVDDAGTVHGPI